MTDIRKDQSESSDISDSPHTRLVPQLRFKGFTGSWEQRQLKNEFIFLSHNTLSRAKLSNCGIGILDIHYGDILIHYSDVLDASAISIPTIMNSLHVSSSRLHNGDVIMTDTAEDITVGRSTEIENLGNRVAVAGLHTIPLRPRNTFAAGYLGYYFNSPEYHRQLFPLMQGIKVTSISRNGVSRTTIRFPTCQEESCISHFFTLLDSLIAAAERKRDLLKKQKQGYLQKLFPKNSKDRPQLRFKGFNGSWERRKLTEFVTRIKTTSSDMTLPIVEYDHLISDEGKLVSPAPLNNDSKSGTLFVPGEILFGKLRPYLKNWLFADFKGIAVGDFWVLDPNHCNPVFLYTLIQSRRFLQCANTSSGSKMPRADWNYVSNSDFYIPSSKNEQARIGHFFKTQDFLIAAAERKIRLMKKLKEGYLQKMFI